MKFQLIFVIYCSNEIPVKLYSYIYVAVALILKEVNGSVTVWKYRWPFVIVI